MNKTLQLGAVLLAACAAAQAAIMSYETQTPTSGVLAGNQGASDGNKVRVESGRNGGQTFLATANFSAVTELWFQVKNGPGSPILASDQVELLFWENTSAESWQGLPNTTVPSTIFDASTNATSLGNVAFVAANDIVEGTWLKFTFDAADQAKIGALSAGTEYAFTLNDSDVTLGLTRVTDTSVSGYNTGASFSNGAVDEAKVNGSRDTNFYVVGIPEPGTLGLLIVSGGLVVAIRRSMML